MRNFSKKLAFVLAAAMVFTAFAPAAKADAAEKEMAMNRATQTLYVNEGVNDKGEATLPEGLYGNVQEYDFYVKNKPANYAKELKFAWESSDEKVATVDNKGLTKAVAVGTATITCTITDKATGDEVAEATAKVTVKANAADVVISNAEDIVDVIDAENRVVDLNRDMYDENDNKTNKRGKFVTDYTRWIAEDADGEAVDATVVAIDQATGKFTFAEDAPAGDYFLYCQTYQSEKYNQTTAESEKVTVTVVETKKVFEVDQTASNKFDLVFDEATDVAIADVTVNKIIKVGNSTGKIPVVVSGAAASQDKKSTSVSVFTNFQNGVNYEISVKGFDDVVTMTAVVGAPDSMTITSKSGIQDGIFVTIQKATELTYTLYDAAGIDVTNTVNGNVVYKPAVTSTADYHIAGNTIYIAKEGIEVTVNAEYISGKYENGKAVGNVPGVGYFVGVAPTPITVADVSFAVKHAYGAYANNEVPLSDETATLEVKIKTTEFNDQANVYVNGAALTKIGGNVTLRLRSSNPDVLAIYRDSYVNDNGETVLLDKIRVFQQGTSAILVELVTNNNGQESVNTIAAYYVTVTAKRYTATVEVGSNGQVTVGTELGFNTAELNVTAKDQYGGVVGITNHKDVKYADGTAVAANAFYRTKGANGQDKFVFYGNVLKEKIATGNEAYLYMTAKVEAGGVWKDISFVVVVKKPNDSEYLAVEATKTTSGNVGRFVTPYDGNNNTEGQKTAQFDVYKMSNGIKKAAVSVVAKPSEVPAGARKGDLFFTIDRDGNDVTSVATVSGSSILLDYSKFADFNASQLNVTGSAVVYKDAAGKTLGGGTYTFTLYKVVDDGAGKKTFAYESAATCSVSCDAGNYTYVKRLSDVAKYTKDGAVKELGTIASDADLKTAYNQDVLRNCFQINGRDGNATQTGVYVVNAKNADGYVFVESITFYESLGGNVYAPYTVPVNVSLVKP